MKRFCKGIVIELYSDVVLWHPTTNNVICLLDKGKKAGFPGCIGSIDCMHWEWKNCPSAWKGIMFQGKSGVATVILEAIGLLITIVVFGILILEHQALSMT
jgi:Plant transposon protein